MEEQNRSRSPILSLEYKSNPKEGSIVTYPDSIDYEMGVKGAKSKKTDGLKYIY